MGWWDDELKIPSRKVRWVKLTSSTSEYSFSEYSHSLVVGVGEVENSASTQGN